MEDALVQKVIKYGGFAAAAVLILVLMEDALVPVRQSSLRT